MAALAEALNALADAIIEARSPRPRKFWVAAYSRVGRNGNVYSRHEIEIGDTLYLQTYASPGAGIISLDNRGMPFGVASSAVAAGRYANIGVQVWLKRWITDGNPCAVCDENSLAGAIPIDEDFPSGDDEPTAHPNCRCYLQIESGDEDLPAVARSHYGTYAP